MIDQNFLGHKVEVTDGEKIWYVAELSGFVMEIDIDSKELKCIWKIPNSAGPCSYRTLFYYENKLYIFPYLQRIMYIYDVYTGEYREIETKKDPELMGCIKRGRFLYAFGDKPEILKLDLENDTVMYIDMRSKLGELEKNCSYWFWTKAFVLDECIYIPAAKTNIIVMLDQNDNVSVMCLGDQPEKWVLVNIQIENGRYHAIYAQGNIDDVRTYIAEYDLKGNLISESNIEEKYPYKIYPFLEAIWSGEKWICFPFGRNELLLRDREHDEILFEIENGIEFLSNPGRGLFSCSVSVDGGTVYSLNQSTGSLVCIHLGDLAVNHSYLEMKENLQYIAKKYYQDMFGFQPVINEDDFYVLKKYINYICYN